MEKIENMGTKLVPLTWALPLIVSAALLAGSAWGQAGSNPYGPQPGGESPYGPGAGFSDPAGSGFGGPAGGGFGGGLGSDFRGGDSAVVSVTAQFTTPTGNQPGRLFITATMQPGWHIYSITQAEGGPIRTTIRVEPSTNYRIAGPFQPIQPPERKSDPLYDGLLVESHHGSVTWYAPLEIAPQANPAQVQIRGVVNAQACERSCLPPTDYPFTATLGAGIPVPNQPVAAPGSSVEPQAAGEGTGGQTAGAPPLATGTLAATLVAAFLGGLVLNLMPCVLPVISLKLLAFVQQSGESRIRVFALNLWFTAGLLVVFLILAGLSASASLGLSGGDGQGLAWGEQFTYTWFKVALIALVFAMALSFLGVWEIPIPGFVGSGKAGQMQSQEGASGAFFKGVFTTILATPCTGPFLGSVFGFTLEQPAYVSFLVFGTIGLGMAFPYLVIGAFPELIRFLPKPGAWMETLKQVMGFLLLGTMVYLFTTMNERYFVPTLALLVGLWFACWLIGRTPLTADPNKRLAAWIGGLGVAAIVGAGAFHFFLQEHELEWKAFSRGALAEARAEGKTVMVDFTADWCPNCKWNMAWAVDTPKVAGVVQKHEVVPLLADWTDRSDTIKQVLRELERQSIPVLAIWPAGAGDQDVIVLDGILSESQVVEALEKASEGGTDTPAARTAMSPR